MHSDIAHVESAQGGAFFLMRDGTRIAEMTYSRAGPALVIIDHTLVDPALRGQGVARQLLDAAVAWARSSNTKAIATCSYVAAQFARDSTLADIVA
jgi:predicted GNAT family acetyltransferase